MTLDLGLLTKGKKERDVRERTVKIAEGFVEELKESQLTFQECMMVADLLRNSLAQMGTNYLNEKYLNHINENI